MKTSIRRLVAFFLSSVMGSASVAMGEGPASLFDLTATDIDGSEIPLSRYAGQVILVVNTASKCGFTPQYEDLEVLHQRYQSQGFSVLGFPSNDFLSQEPSSNEKIKTFCSLTYNVTFPLFSKAPVTGKEIQPVFKFLTAGSGYGSVLWNFEKFLLDRNGKVVDRWRSVTTPLSSSITEKIESLLKAPESGKTSP